MVLARIAGFVRFFVIISRFLVAQGLDSCGQMGVLVKEMSCKLGDLVK